MRFEILNTDQGLSQGYVHDIYQTKNGYLWIITKDGLNRYDGNEFKIFRHDPADTLSLPDNHVLAITEDENGLFWLMTDKNGLCLFDQETEKFYKLTNYIPGLESLAFQHTNCMFGDSDGRLWINGILNIKSVYFTITKRKNLKPGTPLPLRFFIKPHTKQSFMTQTLKLSQNRAKDFNTICKDKINFIWNKDSVFMYQGKKLVFLFSIKEAGIFKAGDPVLLKDVVRDSVRGRIYFLFTDSHFIKYDLNSHTISILSDLFGYSSMASGCVDQIGRIWLSNSAGCIIYDPATNQFYNVYYNSEHLSRISYIFSGITFMDRSGVIYIGTAGYGILKHDYQTEKFHHVCPPYSPFYKNNSIKKIKIYNKLVTVAVQTGGVSTYKFDVKKKKFEYILIPEQVFEKEILTDCTWNLWQLENIQDIDEHNNFWIAGMDGKFFRYNPDSKPKIKSFDLIKYKCVSNLVYLDKAGRRWFGAGKYLAQINTAKNSLVKKINFGIDNEFFHISCIYEENDSTFLIGTNNGLYLLNVNMGKLYKIEKNKLDYSSFNLSDINCFCPDPQNPEKYLWIGTNGGGISKFNKKTHSFIRYSMKDGLPNDVIYGILSDKSGRLWMSTNFGISCFNPRTNKFTNYRQEDGLQGREFNSNAYSKTVDGEMLFGGTQGLNVFIPEEITGNLIPPLMAITEFKILNQSIKPGDKLIPLKHFLRSEDTISLPWNKNNLTFEYTALDFTYPTLNNYKYRLKGYDDSWVMAGRGRKADYTNLSPGEYTFEVAGTNNSGIWSKEPARITIIISPPIWMTWWAKTGYLLLLFAGIVGFIRIRTKNLEQKNIALENKIEQRTEQLKTALKSLEDLDIVKTKLFSIIAHDLRSPMIGIDATLKILQKGTLGEDKKSEMLKTLDASLSTTMNLLDNLLAWAYTQIKGGQVLSKNPVNMKDVVLECAELYERTASTKAIKLKITSNFKENVIVDVNIVRLILRNLISNAIKFSHFGGAIEVNSGQDKEFIYISITDHGIGINPEQLEKLFIMNTEKAREGTQNEKGNGIGLSLCYDTLLKAGGELTVQSTPGKGSTFRATIPYQY